MTPGMPDFGNGNFGLCLGKVVEVHPEHNSVDIAVMHDYRHLVGVPVATGFVTGRTGTVDLHVPDLTTDRHDNDPITGKWASYNTDKRDIIAVVGFIDGAPICIGFICPPICELNFKDDIWDEFRIQRHASDLYETIDRDANHEWYHPSGTFLRVAEDPEHLDLTGKDYDAKWAIRRNTDKAPHVRLVVANAGDEVTDILIDPLGNITIKTLGTMKFTAPVINLDSPDVQIQGVSGGHSGEVY